MLKLERAYDPVSAADGRRFLVERLWPRGVSTARLRLDAWLKDVGPSTELRKWFSHDPEKWSQFRRRYFQELDSQPALWRPIVSVARRGTVTLVYSSHEEEHNTTPSRCGNICKRKDDAGLSTRGRVRRETRS